MELSLSSLEGNEQNKKGRRLFQICVMLVWQVSFPSLPPEVWSHFPLSGFPSKMFQTYQGSCLSLHKPVLTAQKDTCNLVWKQHENSGGALNIDSTNMSVHQLCPSFQGRLNLPYVRWLCFMVWQDFNIRRVLTSVTIRREIQFCYKSHKSKIQHKERIVLDYP